MTTVAALALGLAIGVCGAISPGPLSVALVRGSSAPRRGMLVHLILCVAIGLGTGPLLRSVATTPSAKLALALAYIAFGLVTAVRHYRASPKPLGNASLAVKWILVIGFAVWTGLLGSDLASSIAFACGVWGGVAVWFLALASLGPRMFARGEGSWLRAFTLVGAGLMIAIGLYAVGEFAQTSQTSSVDFGIQRT